MASQVAANTFLRDPMPQFHRKPSQESSPPPSPTNPDAISPESHDPQLRNYALSSSAARPSPLMTDATITRPRIPGRQETPPSPPNSVFIDGEGISPATNSPGGMGSTALHSTRQSVELTSNSLKEKFSRVFRGHKRGGSDTSWSAKSGYARHKKNNSSSTNTTVNPLSHIQSASSRTSYPDQPQTAPSTSAGKGTLYNGSQDNSPISARSSNYNLGVQKSAAESKRQSQPRRIMNGGEVRIEIIPQKSMPDEITPESDADKYYDYYTRTQTESPGHDSSLVVEYNSSNSSARRFVPSYSSAEHKNALARKPTGDTYSSRERRYVEDSVADRFGGFHFGVESSQTSPIDSSGVLRSDSDLSRPVHTNSRKASSSILNSQYDTTTSRTLPSRPPFNRDTSSSSYIINGRKITTPDPGEEVTRELKRLSKISAGSGVSGVAIVVTADGPASTRHSVDSEENASYESHKWTAEEKGKGRAASSDPSGTQRSHTRSLSGHSQWTEGSHHSDENNDSNSLLPAVPEICATRKLKAQEPPSDILVHHGDPKFEYTYRMRQTTDEKPIFVPHYRYDSALSFPNRNALAVPSLAKPPNTSDGMPGSPTFANRLGGSGSILTRPPSAMLRAESDTSGSNLSLAIPQGDFSYDLQHRPKTSHAETYHPAGHAQDRQSLIHPALRHDPERNVKRDVVSMTGLETLGSQFRNASPFSRLSHGRDADSLEITYAESNRHSQYTQASNDRHVTYGESLAPPTPAPTKTRFSNRFSNRFSRVSWRPPQLLLFQMLPKRPKKFMRRSLTPHLYNAQDIALDKSDTESQMAQMVQENEDMAKRQTKIGRMLLFACLIFPPLWVLVACGGFDSAVQSATGGQVKCVGRLEKKIAIVLATVTMVALVVGVVVGVSVAATAAA
ncbi:hypothetical protein BZA77DRAFT_7128 [Pyronema omphalodes]|nr:hypothetical protein BZA77DRAFT_7128 [Pyronema omphalodes]